ncbi:MAG: DVUA0089 family protein, partial [Acidobacteriota bacterium]|nr:DVUA0089 family protein [Acidobacteriota bacterium]
ILSLSMIAPASYGAVINQTYSGSYPGTINGTLQNPDTAIEEAFTVTAPNSTFTAYTTSYAKGGFQPNLTLYGSNGITVTNGTQWAQPPAGAMADPTTGQTLDGYLMTPGLQAGTYTMVLSEFDLTQSATAGSLADGFVSTGHAGFTDVDGNVRNGSYSVNVNLTSARMTATPEPATFWLMSPFLLIGFGMLARKHLSVQK